MKKFYLLIIVFVSALVNAQTPVQLSSLTDYTYTETFADLANWTFNTSPTNGTFTAGTGSAAWKGNIGTGACTSTCAPNPNIITTSSTSWQADVPGSTGGVYRMGTSIGMLSTGTTDNRTSVTMDLFIDFTGLNAGTLSFDWASINNGTGTRKASLKVYASVDGTNFTDITAASVLNFTNGTPTSGQISFVDLPAILNNSATAQLRFYYYNGTGGTSGARPKLNLDNVKVTGVPANACTTPLAQPTNFTITNSAYSTLSVSFTAASPAPNKYLVVMSANTELSSLPQNNLNYAIGDNLGDGTVVYTGSNTSFIVSSLDPSTTYNFFIFSYNSVCSGGPLYYDTNPLTGSGTTLSGNQPCTAPAAQVSNFQLSKITPTSIYGTYDASALTDYYLIVKSTSPTLSGNPVNGTTYNVNQSLGGGNVVAKTPLTYFTANNLTSGVHYYFFVFSYNYQNCIGGPTYNTVNPTTANATTTVIPACSTPAAQPVNLELTADNTTINGYFKAANADAYLVVISTASSLSINPTDGTTYVPGNALGNGTIVSYSTATSFIATDLTPATQYYIFIFAVNNQCTGGPKYLTVAPLQQNITTTAVAATNTYFGNLHAHSSYSDGNKDNTTLIPDDDYAYAKNTLCMDYLGISEHNHFTATGNPGMLRSKYPLGISQAAAATTSNFLAMYGMEWGVISNGGHVIIYGIDQLIGWETLSGSPNYDIYVPKSDYLGKAETTGTTGLFRTINGFFGNNAFATLAHPNSSDFNNLSNIPYDLSADSAIVGTAIGSGPAFSTNTTYTEPPSLGDVDYFRKLLSVGYKLGPTIDHDNHYLTFGRTTYSRLAVVAPALNPTSFRQAMRSMNFYATEDCDTRLIFTINNEPMGSTLSGNIPPAISVYVKDPTNSGAKPKIVIMYGVPGSNILSVAVDSATANNYTYNFTDFNMPVSSEGYYYADVTIGGARVISAPIWYTRYPGVVGTLPLTFTSVNATALNQHSVKVNWTTTNEKNSKLFIVERSVNGVNFYPLGTIIANGNSVQNLYSFTDDAASNGINYYRIKQVDNDGKFTYSNVVSVDLLKVPLNSLNVYPNPVKNNLSLNIQSEKTAKADFKIIDIFGRVMSSFTKQLNKGTQQFNYDVTGLSVGNYMIVMQTEGKRITEKFTKQ